jgi:hypothetical protein
MANDAKSAAKAEEVFAESTPGGKQVATKVDIWQARRNISNLQARFRARWDT